MRLRERTTTSNRRPTHRDSESFPKTLTLQEAALLTGTSPRVLWQEIRSGRVPFTIFAGQGGEGNSVLLRPEDLVRIGLLQGPPPTRPLVKAPQRLPTPPRKAGKSFRVGRLGRVVMAGLLGLLLIAGVAPWLTHTRMSRLAGPIASSGSTETSCEGKSSKAACRATAPRSPQQKASTSRSLSRSRGQSPSASRATAGSKVGSRSPLVSVAGSPVTAPGPSPGGYPTPPNIPSNCSRDVTPALTSWIASVPNNSTLMFPMGGCYRIDRSLAVSNRVGLTFEGSGTTFDGSHNANGTAPHWWIQHSSRITLKNMTVRGANPHAGAREGAYVPGMEWQSAYDLWGSEYILLDHVQAYDLYGDFVEITPMWVGQTPVTSSHITVQSSHFERSGRQGISVLGGNDVLIQNNYIGQVPHDILDIEPSFPSVPIRNIRFVGNRTGAVYLVWFANHGACNVAVSDVTITDNVMEAQATNDYSVVWIKPPAGCARRGPFTIQGNTFLVRQPPDAFDLTLTHDVRIRGNQVRFVFANRTRVLVGLHKSSRADVENNTVTADARDQVVFVTADADSDYFSSGNKRV